MMKFGAGQAVPRTEDGRFLTGQGRYLDDVDLSGQAIAYVLRSPHAHAHLASIETGAARAAPGVLGVFTGRDYVERGYGLLPCQAEVENKDGSPRADPPHRPLATDRVRHVGDAVALVVAETIAQAKDAAELIEIDYQVLPAVTDPARALEEGAPQLWADAPGNLCFDWERGNLAATDAAFAKAHHVTRIDLVNNRIVVNSMEPRGAIAQYDADTDRTTLYVSTQGAHSIRRSLCDLVLDIPREKLRVITPDVGGGFGMKLFLYAEYLLVLWAARELGRPVKWIAERGDSFISDSHGRDHVSHAELALDAEARFLGLRVSTIANLGAHLSPAGPFVPTMAGSAMLAGVYTTPAVYVEVKGAFTNTVPVDAYRGAGRPEAIYVLERLVDKAARELGLSPAEIRRRNFIRPEDLPFTSAFGLIYDSGDFAGTLEKALGLADWDGFESRRAEARKAGKLRGIGLTTYIEVAGGPPEEHAEIRIDADGRVSVLAGTMSNGQGHETAYAQLVVDKLGVPFENIRVIQGDTDLIAEGYGTGGSRSLMAGGGAVVDAARALIEQGKPVAGDLLEAAEVDIEFTAGAYGIAGTDRRVGILEVAKAAGGEGSARGAGGGLGGSGFFTAQGRMFPNGCHVCELEVDPDSGAVRVLRYTVVDDFGTIVNPALVRGQVHGGVGQGLGQALLEHCVYDEASGQLLSGSLIDYALPRADDLPSLEVSFNEVPCRTNALGVKGCGEAGATAAPPAAINALPDALSPLGVRHVDMPATSERLWRIIREHDRG